jgi:hypothetical protein
MLLSTVFGLESYTSNPVAVEFSTMTGDLREVV